MSRSTTLLVAVFLVGALLQAFLWVRASNAHAQIPRLRLGLAADQVGLLIWARSLPVHPRDQVIARRLRRRGIWSPAETALSKQLLRPGMIVLDIGANIGYFTLVFAR
ncbi:MAG: hypothetical protein ACHQ4J_17180, partial [Candidatus Binatia bacterium]